MSQRCVYKTALIEDMDSALDSYTSHMANFHLYITGCLLLLTWNYRTTVALPVRRDLSSVCAYCAPLFRSLLLNVSGLLKNGDLWTGIQSDKVKVPANFSDTVLACAPAVNKTRCHMQGKESFNESECFDNILKDLVRYEAIISSYINLELWHRDVEIPPFTQTLHIIHSLLQACSLAPSEETSLKEDTSGLWEKDSYSDRLTMLPMMRAFYIRTITFNRAVGYIASGEHMKSSPF